MLARICALGQNFPASPPGARVPEQGVNTMPAIALPLPLSKHRALTLVLASLALLVVVVAMIRLTSTSHKLVYMKTTDDFSRYGEVAPGAAAPAKGVSRVAGQEGGGGGGEGRHVVDLDRKIVRTGTLELEVKSPADTAESIRLMAEHLGGYLVSSQISGTEDMPTAAITIRVPVARFDEARTEIKKMAARVEMEKTDASDVTREYVDQDARLRNLRATESQYLAIMKRATTVKDTLAVSEKLSDVRSQIEQDQAEFDALSKQIETVALNISMRALADTRVFGLHWRPWYQLKVAMRDGLDGLGNYAATMAAVIMYLPAVLLWVVTVLVGAAIAWRILRWAARILFAFPKTVSSEKVIS